MSLLLTSLTSLLAVQTASLDVPIHAVVARGSLRSGIGRVRDFASGTPTFEYLYDLPTAPAGHAYSVGAIGWNPQNERLVVASTDGFDLTISELEPATGLVLSGFTGAGLGACGGIDVDTQGRAYFQDTGSTSLWCLDLTESALSHVADVGQTAGGGFALGANGLAYAIDRDTHLRVVDLTSGQVADLGPTYLWQLADFDFTPDGRLLALLRYGRVFEIDPSNGTLMEVGYVSGLHPSTSMGLEGATGWTFAVPRPGDWRAYCEPNDVSLWPVGTASAASNDLTIAAAGLPRSTFAVLVAADSEGAPFPVLGIQGSVCLATPIVRLTSSLAITTRTGNYSTEIDLRSFPVAGAGTAVLAPGDRRSFQLWYREVGATTTASLSTALEVTVQ